ncbi:helix-turn-helix domain-containing protein [Spirillospora sp. CA-294931]|uniref:helix-turn-helix domain-containing protein n=1 Tax=Spirillospora sp. CA-294931 TaxID=3240042 RepID=UPI003D8A465B
MADDRHRSFAAILDELCVRPAGRRRSYSNTELARAVNALGGDITDGYVSHLRKGNRDNPTLQTIQDLAAALGVSPAVFVGGRRERRDEENPRRSFPAKLRHLFEAIYPPERGPYTPEEVATAISADGRYGSISASHIRELLNSATPPNPRLKHILGLADHFGLADEDGPRAAYFLDDELASAIDAELADLVALRDAGVVEFMARVVEHVPAWSPELRRAAVEAITQTLESGEAGWSFPLKRE